jgi:hypothetical protein
VATLAVMKMASTGTPDKSAGRGSPPHSLLTLSPSAATPQLSVYPNGHAFVFVKPDVKLAVRRETMTVPNQSPQPGPAQTQILDTPGANHHPPVISPSQLHNSSKRRLEDVHTEIDAKRRRAESNNSPFTPSRLLSVSTLQGPPGSTARPGNPRMTLSSDVLSLSSRRRLVNGNARKSPTEVEAKALVVAAAQNPLPASVPGGHLLSSQAAPATSLLSPDVLATEGVSSPLWEKLSEDRTQKQVGTNPTEGSGPSKRPQSTTQPSPRTPARTEPAKNNPTTELQLGRFKRVETINDIPHFTKAADGREYLGWRGRSSFFLGEGVLARPVSSIIVIPIADR